MPCHEDAGILRQKDRLEWFSFVRFKNMKLKEKKSFFPCQRINKTNKMKMISLSNDLRTTEVFPSFFFFLNYKKPIFGGRSLIRLCYQVQN